MAGVYQQQVIPFPFGLTGLPLPQAAVGSSQLKYADVLQNIHGYWKSKVIQVHSQWKEVTESISVSELEKKKLSAETEFQGCKLPKLKLGDRVKIIEMEKRRFKILHKKVGIWAEELTALIGKEAVVMDFSLRYLIGVAIVGNSQIWHVHGFALQRLDGYPDNSIWTSKLKFKVDDAVVITDNVDNGVLRYLQKSVRTPAALVPQLRGSVGRVMCFFGDQIVVTFDEITYEILHEAILEHCGDKESAKKKTSMKQRSNTDFPVGTKVKVKTDLDSVLNKQIGYGGWSYKMTKFLGKEGTVEDNSPALGGIIIVKFSPFESYHMNRENLVRVKKEKRRNRSGNESDSGLHSAQFMVGDVVRLNIAEEDLQSNLQLLRIPLEFLSTIGSCGEFVGYQTRNRGVVDFGDGVEFIFDINLLKKVGPVFAETYKKIKAQDNKIGIDSKVVLWIGPKNFVKTCLKGDFKDGFEQALSEEGTVEGYDENGNVILRYPDDKLYSIPDEYICTPRQIWKHTEVKRIEWKNEPVELPRRVSYLECGILHSVTEVLKKNEENDSLGWSCTIKETEKEVGSTYMLISFPGQIGDFTAFIETLKSKLQTEDMRASYDKEILQVLSPGCNYFLCFQQGGDQKNQTAAAGPSSAEKSFVPTDSLKYPGEIFQRSSSITEPVQGKNVAAPTLQAQDACTIAIPNGVTQVVLQLGNAALARPDPLPQIPAQEEAPGQASGMVIRPITNINNLNMFSENGGNTLNMPNSYNRQIKVKSQDQ